ncbi:EAL domain-containing protein [Spirulina sp. CS-785/01]|uniref:EAL domain-containing response regulator n=1 Tax=Spirulina sp. CS-785/01 TaxID=3021716 RepID=UPI00232C6402|nr:EAL domain-containing response regulator [Spirulina sp. CS-785/01]MDB9314514.1 EAL domain-containing protein [Spirulina sp. CS-785/01]
MTKILIVEDDELVRDNIFDLLEAEGFEVMAAENGQQGLDLAIATTPDLILCDVVMPQLSGYEVLAAIRKNPLTAATPFILLTAKTAKEDFRMGMKLGAEDFLTKPCSRAELVAVIDTQLEKRQILQDTYTRQLQETQDQLNYLIYHDSLTQLPNRMSLQDRFSKIQRHAPQLKPGLSIPVYVLCLERLNRISDNFGYEYADLLLQQAAQRLKQEQGEQTYIAYVSFNQFVILSNRESQRQGAIARAEDILTFLQKPFVLNGQEAYVTASIGIALYPHNGDTLDILLNNAKAALNYAHTQGGNQYQFFTPTFSSNKTDTLAFEKSFRLALEQEEFQVYYQPRISLTTGKIIGAEALLRWFQPGAESVSPSQFIPLAEETGTIVSLGEWVLRTAARQAKLWMNQTQTPFYMAVNLSGRQFVRSDLSRNLAKILSEAELESRFLDLELTENILVKNPFVARQKLLALKSLGVNIAIDDFGTGYSSLAYLQQFPFDILKIDRCFIRNIASQEKNAAIVTAILQMAHNLQLKVIAEGVETINELEFLQDHPCDEIQGFLFSRPLPAHEFSKFLEQKGEVNFLGQ